MFLIALVCMQHEQLHQAVLSPHKAPVAAATMDIPSLPSVDALLAWQQGLKEEALRLARVEMWEDDNTKISHMTALKVRDASMLCTLFGHSSLVQRGQLLVSAKCSKFATTPCMRPNCPGQGRCNGNTFVASDPEEPHQADMLSIPHHKTENKGIRGMTLMLQVGWK